jgi:hypothetical protein
MRVAARAAQRVFPAPLLSLMIPNESGFLPSPPSAPIPARVGRRENGSDNSKKRRSRFRYLAEGGRWFDDDSLSLREGGDAIIAV